MVANEEMAYTDLLVITRQILDGSMSAEEFATSDQPTGYDIFFAEPSSMFSSENIGKSAVGEEVVRPNSAGRHNPDFRVNVHIRTDGGVSSEPQPSTVEWVYSRAEELGHEGIQARGINPVRLIISFWNSYSPREVRNA